MKLPWYALLFPASQAALLGVLLTLLAEHGMTAGMWILMILLSVLCALCDWLLFRTLKQLTLRRLTEAREQALAESVTMQEHRAAALEKEAAEAEAVRAQIRAHLDKAEELLRPLGVGRWAIVCDDTVAALYGAPLARRTGWPLVTFPAGEGSKSLEEYDRLCRRLVQLGLTRSDGIVALGGGVTGDLAGFAAATLLRGVALVQAPTTLLAQVDSAVGGKTGLDLPEGKNLLGCFYQPRMVLADTVCLATLPRRQLACGMAEVIKYGCIADEELLTRLEQQEPDWPRIIRRCLACKAALVAQDERDEGPRRLLNFGHTFGHAMEALGGGRYTHGECVAAGMMEMLRWQTAHGSDQTAMLARLGTLLERYDLPRRLDLPETAWRQYLLRDKKRSGGEMTIAVLERPGHGVLWSVTPEELLEETRWM